MRPEPLEQGVYSADWTTPKEGSYLVEMIAKRGDITSLPSGHDAWVVGDEPVVVVDWYGASNYARRG